MVGAFLMAACSPQVVTVRADQPTADGRNCMARLNDPRACVEYCRTLYPNYKNHLSADKPEADRCTRAIGT